jgi:glycosyltransferase involved in cell wall biosynthesis
MKMNEPIVSVIIPNYNHAPYLHKRIDSVLTQTFQDFEVIILDDCSTDESRKVIEHYNNHPKVTHIVLNETNSGSPFIQWQRGFSLAKGEFIWIAESDDYADTKFLELLIPTFNEHKSVGVVYSDSNVIDADNVVHLDFYKQHRNTSFKTSKWNSNYIKNGLEEIKENLFFECTINNTSAMIFKKGLLQYVDFTKLTQFKYCGDWFFFISLLNHCDIAYKKEALSFFKYGTDNFKKGTKSIVNYFQERAMVRYYFWNDLRKNLGKNLRIAFYKQLASEMKIQMNEIIKGNSSFSKTLKSYQKLFAINRQLFKNQFIYTGRAYLYGNQKS